MSDYTITKTGEFFTFEEIMISFIKGELREKQNNNINVQFESTDGKFTIVTGKNDMNYFEPKRKNHKYRKIYLKPSTEYVSLSKCTFEKVFIKW